MLTLAKEQRNQLAKAVLEARDRAEAGARKALHALGVDEADTPAHLTPEQRTLRRALRAQARQLGDREDPEKKGQYLIRHLVEKIAYDQWHRLLFARFLAENDLLISPQHGVGVSLEDCGELAQEQGLRDGWEVAVRFAAEMLPQIFRADDPAGQIQLAPEDRTALQQLVIGLPRDLFLAGDALGWVYQFWQAKRKDEVNKSEVKIGADELSPVTQLFTEDYMVLFLLHNTLGAWWAGKRMGIGAATEEEARATVTLPGVNWEYLRFVRDEQTGAWRPAAGTFEGWPRTAKELRLLDPCMGSGHFLVFALLILVAFRKEEEGLSEAEACEAVLRDNLFGLELDPRCTQIAAFNLALAAWKLRGYCQLPPLNLACCGLAPRTRLEDWLQLAEEAAAGNPLAPDRDLLGQRGETLLSQKLKGGMERLYQLFKDGPILGSLINPRKLSGDLFTAEFHELQPLLEKALQRESADETVHELAVAAQGMAKAAEILAGQFHLVATNVLYLGRGKQSEVLKEFCERHHPDAKADLATCFVSRCLDFCATGGTTALVTPQNWLFLGTYKKLRQRLLGEAQWDVVVRLGEHAFDSPQAAGAFVALLALTRGQPGVCHALAGLDASAEKTPEAKADALRAQDIVRVGQKGQLGNPDAAISFNTIDSSRLLGRYAECFQGISTGDSPRLALNFWELSQGGERWTFFQAPPESTRLFSGREFVVDWVTIEAGFESAAIRGNEAWTKPGVAIGQMRELPATLYSGNLFSNSTPVIIPHRKEFLGPIWEFCSSPQFNEELRKQNPKLSVDNGYIGKVPFDLAQWQQVAEKYPNGLPKPHSDDPTQWLFNGHPKGSEAPLQVAVARLLGYRWPRQTGSSFPDCPALEPDGLEPFADEDGIVCISAIKGEQPAAERLRALLAAAYGSQWSAQQQAELFAQVGGKTLEDWLRHGFFEQHCQLFHQRPFLWHIWDGRKDGFSALVNYHQFNRAALEKLIYTYLGDWISRQRAAVEAGEEGSDAKLAAALELKAELEKILEGEAPYDIFIRWKPLEKQPIGWAPDLNDGVRLNIRPFVTAGVLRKNPKIHWNKDRGKDVPSAPWFKVFKGERINEHHLRLEEKRK